MSIEVKTTVAFQPWQVPNFALLSQKPGLKQDGIQPLPSIPLADLSEEVVEALARAWLDDLYAKTRHHNPFSIIRHG